MTTEPIKFLSVGHQSKDIHIASDGTRAGPANGGASLYTALTAFQLTDEQVAVVTSSSSEKPYHWPDSSAPRTIEAYADPDSEQTVFEDWIDGDARHQRLVSGAPAIKSLGALGQRGRNASTVFACPLLDELPFDCRSWFWADFTCLVPQGWFRVIAPDGDITLAAPDESKITGPWDLVVLSQEEAVAVGDLSGWRQLARILAVTQGSRGATIFVGGEEHRIEAVKPSTVVDTTGAGDVWAAAFTITFQETRNITYAGEFASAAAAICVSRPGLEGVPESREEVEELLLSANR